MASLRRLITAALLLSCPAAVLAQDAPRTSVPSIEMKATRTTRPPDIDGHLNEEAWATATPVSGFTQRDPDEGKPATEDTEVRILYDDVALYVGVRLFDDDPHGL